MPEPVKLIPIATQVRLVGSHSREFGNPDLKYFVSKYVTSRETLHVELTTALPSGGRVHPIIVPFEDIEVLPRDTIPIHEIEQMSDWLRKRVLKLPVVDATEMHPAEEILYEVMTSLAELQNKGEEKE